VAHFYRHGIALSPDGKWIAYLGGSVDGPLAQTNQIYLRPLDHWESRPIPGTTDARNITFSPDSQWVAFAQNEAEVWAIKRLSISTSQIRTICGDLRGYDENGNGISWGDDNWIVFDGDGPGLNRVPAKGGQPLPLNIQLPDTPRETRMQLPFVLPGSRSVLFTAVRHHGNLEPRFTDIFVWSADTGQCRKLIEGATDARYVPTGHLVFAREGRLLTVPFDRDHLQLTGPEVQTLPGVNHSVYFGWRYWETGVAQYSVSNTGLLAYASGSVIPEERFELLWVDRRGREEVVDLKQQWLFSSVRISPDGRRLALARAHPPYAVWIHDLERKTMRRQTFKGRTIWAIWGPESDSFTYESDVEGPTRIYRKTIGSGPEEFERVPTGEESGWHIPGSWSPDGQTLVFTKPGRAGLWDLWATSNGQTTRLTDTESYEGYPEFSPDGRWVLYTSDESGRNEVYVKPYGHGGRMHQVSTQGGHEAAWSTDGTEIVFRRSGSTSDGPRGFFSVTFVETDASVRLGKPVFLFEDRYLSGGPGRSYDVTRDGRFVLRRRVAGDTERFVDEVFPARIHVVQNWFEELKARMGESGRVVDQGSR
jgi:Tol biopolymer transport system component